MAEDDVPTKAAAAEDVYTKDGTVDFRGNPAKRNATGTWKACPFILGTAATLGIWSCKLL